MLQPVPLKMPKPYAYKNNSNDLKYATLKKPYFIRFQGCFILIANEFYKSKICEKIRIKS